MPDEWSGTGSRDMDGTQLGCWRERESVSDQLLGGGRTAHACGRDAAPETSVAEDGCDVGQDLLSLGSVNEVREANSYPAVRYHPLLRIAVAVTVYGLFGVLADVHARTQKEPESGFDELVVRVDEPSAALDLAKQALDSSLSGVQPMSRTPPQSKVINERQYILYGDLFNTGNSYALVELDIASAEGTRAGVALAELTDDGTWRIQGLWRISTTWRPEGWQPTDEDYLPATPATTPFKLRELSGDGVPELILAGEVEKYFQSYYLLRFVPNTHALVLVAESSAEPTLQGEHVRLYSNSGRLAIYEQWNFLKWSGDRLVPVASWHDEVGYGTEDPTYSEAERVYEDGKHEVIRIQYVTGQEYDGDEYKLTKDEKPFGSMRIEWRTEDRAHQDEIEKAWLFERTTGLPRKLYPQREDGQPIAKLEELAVVRVDGSAEAAKRFSVP